MNRILLFLLFLLAFCLPSELLRGQEITYSVPFHPIYFYDPTATMMAFQQAQIATGHQVDWRDKSGSPRCWVDADGQINCVGGLGAGVCTNLSQVTDLYVSTAGSDTTGTGSSGSPYRSISRAFQDIPGIVCGRYIVHLMDTGNYTGQNNLSGRLFAGGGQSYSNGDVNWPFSNAGASPFDNTWPYSWVEVVGSTANPNGYVVGITLNNTLDSGQGVFSLSHANLTLRGISIREGGYGVHAANYSFVNLAGVAFQNNQTHVLATHQSKVYFDESGTVGDLGVDYITCTNSTLGAVPFAGTRCIEAQEGSTVTDLPASGAIGSTTVGLTCTASGGGSFVNCIRLETSSFLRIRGILTVGRYGVVLKDSFAVIEDLEADCGGTAGPALNLIGSRATSAAFSGSIWNISNCTTGVRVDSASVLSTYPSFTNVTTLVRGSGGDTVPEGITSRDARLVNATIVETVAFSATPTFNVNQGGIKKITLTGDVTSSTITGQRPGDDLTFLICQDGVGGHTFAWPANVRGEEAIGATLSTCSVQRFSYDQGATAWLAVAPMVKNQ